MKFDKGNLFQQVWRNELKLFVGNFFVGLVFTSMVVMVFYSAWRGYTIFA